jgi:hypothetical protein
MTPAGETAPAKKPKEWAAYLKNILGLWPGHLVPVFEVHNTTVGDLTGWEPDELNLAIEEGRRQLDRLFDELERVRVRAQFLFTSTVVNRDPKRQHLSEKKMVENGST